MVLSQKSYYFYYRAQRELFFSILIHNFAKDHSNNCTHRRSRNPRPHNPGRVHAPILAPVRDHIHRNQLQRRDIQYQERTHLVACNSLFPDRSRQPSLSPVFLQLRKLLHRPKPRRRRRPPKPQNIGDDIRGNVFFGRMIGRKAGEQESDQRPYSDRSSADDAGFPCDLHKSHPERHYPHHSNAQGDCFFGRIKRGVSDIRHPSSECGEYNADQYHTCP